jgi:hypothetical protein
MFRIPKFYAVLLVLMSKEGCEQGKSFENRESKVLGNKRIGDM